MIINILTLDLKMFHLGFLRYIFTFSPYKNLIETPNSQKIHAFNAVIKKGAKGGKANTALLLKNK